MAIYFTSDLHFEHRNIITYCNRPYFDVTEMGYDLVRRWNEVVSDTDEIYVLGDFSLSIVAIEIWASKLNGIKYLVSGNHDFTHRVNSKKVAKHERAIKAFRDAGFVILPDEVIMERDDVKLKLCHLPYGEPDTDQDTRYLSLRPKIEDEWALLCGHVHGEYKTRLCQGKVMYNVGVDVHNLTPIKLDDIIKDIKDQYALYGGE